MNLEYFKNNEQFGKLLPPHTSYDHTVLIEHLLLITAIRFHHTFSSILKYIR